jgi:hypothetical protein
MRTVLVVASVLAVVVAVGSIVATLVTQPAALGLRLVASVLLIDQATLAFLFLRLPVDLRGIRLALRAGSAFAIAAGVAILILCAQPHAGPAEIAMPAVGVLLVAHGALTLRALQGPPRAESA